MSRDRFTLTLSCPCGAKGSVTWEESGVNPLGPQRRLITISTGFHAETGRTRSGDPLIVCNGCDQIQPD